MRVKSRVRTSTKNVKCVCMCECVYEKKGKKSPSSTTLNWRSTFENPKFYANFRRILSFIHSYIHNNCSVSVVFVLHTILNCKWQISFKWFILLLRVSSHFILYHFCTQLFSVWTSEKYANLENVMLATTTAAAAAKNCDGWRHMRDKVYYPRAVGIDIFISLCISPSLLLYLWLNFNFKSYFKCIPLTH